MPTQVTDLSQFHPLLSSYADMKAYGPQSETMRQIVYKLRDVHAKLVGKEPAVQVAIAIVLGEMTMTGVSAIMSPEFEAMDMPLNRLRSDAERVYNNCVKLQEVSEWLVRNAKHPWWVFFRGFWNLSVLKKHRQLTTLLKRHFPIQARRDLGLT